MATGPGFLDNQRPERYSSLVVPFRARATAILFATAALTSAARGGAQPGDEPAEAECRSIEDPLTELLAEDEQCRPGPVEKHPKIYPRDQGVTRRRGLERVLTTLYNVHTREALPVFEHRRPGADVLGEFFRCRGFAVRAALDPRLIETVLGAAEEFDSRRVRIVSAFRSPKFNDALAKKGRRVAQESKHTRGEAIDFGLAGVKAAAIGKWLWDSFEGGVGTYPDDDFVHIDVGPKRRWTGR